MTQIALHLDDLVDERQILADFLAQPTAYSDPEFTAKNKRFSELETLIAKAEERQQLTKNLEEARQLATGGDEIAELAKAESTPDRTRRRTIHLVNPKGSK